MDYKFQQYDGGRSKSKYQVNADDCVVRTIATVSRISYDSALQILNKAGVFNDGFQISTWFQRIGYTFAGYKIKGYSFPLNRGKITMTRAQFANTYKKGRFCVKVSGHLYCQVDGTVYDLAKGLGEKRVYNAWQFYK